MRIVALVCLLAMLLPGLAVQAQGQSENCIVTPLQMRGQAHTGLAGAGGGTGGDLSAEEVVDADWILDVASAIGTGDEPVAILVVDEFPPSQQAGNPNRPLMHGEMVMEVLEQLSEALNAPDNLMLVEVNIAAGQSGRYQTNSVARELENAIEDLDDEGVTRFVINMSFALVPCNDGSFSHQQLVNQHNSNPNASLESMEGEADAIELLEQAEDSTLLDPLHELLAELLAENGDDLAVIAVAAAGNFGEDAPFYPAGWEQVISVSASVGSAEDATLWAESNHGEVMTPGAWFLFSDDEYRAGTSFATPVMSFIVALHLSQSDHGCELGTESAPLQNLGDFDNAPYDEALDC